MWSYALDEKKDVFRFNNSTTAGLKEKNKITWEQLYKVPVIYLTFKVLLTYTLQQNNLHYVYLQLA